MKTRRNTDENGREEKRREKKTKKGRKERRGGAVGGKGGRKVEDRAKEKRKKEREREREISNLAIYPLNPLLLGSSLCLLDFAVRICGMSEAGTSPSGFLIAKRIRPGPDRRADRAANLPLSGLNSSQTGFPLELLREIGSCTPFPSSPRRVESPNQASSSPFHHVFFPFCTLSLSLFFSLDV